MKGIKRYFKNNSHNSFFKGLAGFGRSLNRFYENRNHDLYSNGEVTILKKIAKFNPKIIIDGGANVGEYSLEISKYNPACKIYAFEPVEHTYTEMVEQVKQHENIIPINKGLFSENCTRKINVFDESALSSIYDIKGIDYKANKTTSIELLKGDDFIKENNLDFVDFLKLDLEGAEYAAMLGFENSFKARKIRAVQFEYGYINITTKKLLIDFYELLENHGYRVGKIFPKTVEFRDYDFIYEDFYGPNFIAVHKEDKALIEALQGK